MERRTSAQFDDTLAALNHVLPQGGPLFVGQRRRADQFGQRFAVHFRGGSEYGHLFAVSSVSARTGYPVLRDAEMLR